MQGLGGKTTWYGGGRTRVIAKRRDVG